MKSSHSTVSVASSVPRTVVNEIRSSNGGGNRVSEQIGRDSGGSHEDATKYNGSERSSSSSDSSMHGKLQNDSRDHENDVPRDEDGSVQVETHFDRPYSRSPKAANEKGSPSKDPADKK